MSGIQEQRKYIQSSGLANDLLIGMADGIMLPFAFAAMISFIVSNSETVLWICILESVILALSLGIASYLTVVNQAEEYPQDENNPASRGNFVPHLQLQKIIANLGLGADIAEQAAEDGEKYKIQWSDLLTSHNIGEATPDFDKAKRSGFYTAIAFLSGALLPVVPYVFSPSSTIAFKYSALITALGLIVFGYCKAVYTGQRPWKVIWRLVLTGIIVVGASLLLAWLFKI